MDFDLAIAMRHTFGSTLASTATRGRLRGRAIPGNSSAVPGLGSMIGDSTRFEIDPSRDRMPDRDRVTIAMARGTKIEGRISLPGMNGDFRRLDRVAAEMGGPKLREALDQIGVIVLDGLCHGHFRATISIGIGKGNRRDLVIEAGKSHKFTIPENELPR